MSNDSQKEIAWLVSKEDFSKILNALPINMRWANEDLLKAGYRTISIGMMGTPFVIEPIKLEGWETTSNFGRYKDVDTIIRIISNKGFGVMK